MAEQAQTQGAAQPPAVQQKQAVIQLGNHGVVLRSLDEMWRFAKAIAASGLAPKSLQTPESIMVAMQMGAEVGLPPMASMQNIAVINGRPSIWGDAMKGVCEASGLMTDFYEDQVGTPMNDDYGFSCYAKREGRSTGSCNVFTVADAKRAGLWAKPGPWTQYPQRMLKYRARSFTLRDEFPDVLRGLHSTEEMMDVPLETQYEDVAPPPTTPGARSEALVEKIKPKAQDAPETDTVDDLPDAEPVAEAMPVEQPPDEPPADDSDSDLEWILAELGDEPWRPRYESLKAAEVLPKGFAYHKQIKLYTNAELETIRAAHWVYDSAIKSQRPK